MAIRTERVLGQLCPTSPKTEAMMNMMAPISGRDLRELSSRNVERPMADRGRGACILLVDDDAAIREMVESYLKEHDMHVTTASQRSDMALQFATAEPSLVILDLRLDQEDGLDLLRAIRANSDVPVIIITGHRCDEIDRVVGLELRADDYVTKPFGLRELLARIRAVLRRREAGRAAPQRDVERGRYRFGGWQIDRRTRRLTDPNGAPVSLTKGEYTLLIAFLDAPQRLLTREPVRRTIKRCFEMRSWPSVAAADGTTSMRGAPDEIHHEVGCIGRIGWCGVWTGRCR